MPLSNLQSINGVQIFRVGTWNGMKFTLADLKGIAESFNATKDAVKPFLKLGHNNGQKVAKRDDLPAVGWVENVRLEGDTLVADFKGIPGKVFELIEKGAFRTRSIEIWRNVEVGGVNHPWLLTAVALLGATQPAVDSLQDMLDLFAAESGDVRCFESEEGEKLELTYDDEQNSNKEDEYMEEYKGEFSALGDHIRKLREEKGLSTEQVAKAAGIDASTLNQIENGKIERPPDRRLSGMARLLGTSLEALKKLLPAGKRKEDDEKMAHEAELVNDANVRANKLAGEKAELSSKVEELSTQIEALQGELKEANAEAEKFKAEKRNAEIDAKLDTLVMEKKINPAQKPALKAILSTMPVDADSMKFEIGDKKGLTLEDAVMEFIGNGSPAGLQTKEESDNTPVDDDKGTDDEKLFKKAEKYAEENKVSFRDALISVSAETNTDDEDEGE